MGTMLREYETVFVLNPELSEDALKTLLGRLKDVLERMGASLLREDLWGKRKMSFTVKKQIRGNYMMWLYAGPAGTVEELERTMRNLEGVIRFMTEVHGSVSDLEARMNEVETLIKEEAAERAKREAEREQRAREAATEERPERSERSDRPERPQP